MKKFAAATGAIFLIILIAHFVFIYNIEEITAHRRLFFIINNSVVAIFAMMFYFLLYKYHYKREKESFKKMFMENYAVELIIEPVTGAIYDANNEACRFYGYSYAEIKKLTIFDINTLKPEEIRKSIESATSLRVNKFTFKHRLANGNVRDVDVSSGPIIINGKKYLHSVIFDVTEKHMISELIKKSRENYIRIFDDFPVMIWIADKDGKVKYFNNERRKFTGRKPEDEFDDGWRDGIYFEDEQRVAKTLAESITARKNFSIKYRMRRFDGKYRWIQDVGAPFYNIDGNFDGYIGLQYDVDDEEKHIQILKESEDKYSRLFENMSSGIALHEIIRDIDGNPVDYRFLAVNRKFEELTGLKRENILGKTVLEVIPDTERYWIEKYGAIEAEGREETFENYSRGIGRYYRVNAYTPEKGKFATIVTDITLEKELAEKVAESQEKYRKLIEMSPTITYSVSTKRGLTFVSAMVEAVLGYTQEELLREPMTVFSMVDKNIFDEMNLSMIIDKYEGNFGLEHTIIDKKGEIRWLFDQVIERRDLEDEIIIEGVAVDITERKKMEIELQKAKMLYQKIFDENPIGIALVDSKNRILESNRALQEFLGYEKLELEKKTVAEISVADDEEEDMKQKKRVKNDEIGSYSMEKRYITKDGNYKWGKLSVRLLSRDKGNEDIFIGMLEDIDEDKKHAIEKKRFETMIENAPVTIVVTDIDGNVTYANPMFEKISGYKVEEVRGKKTNILNSGTHDKYFYKNLWETIKGGQIWSGEFYNKTKDNQYYWEKAVIAPVKGESGEILNFIAIKEDITELKKTIEHLERAKESADAANKAKSTFLSNMSHELRTPLNGILGFAGMLKNEDMSDTQKEMAGLIESSGKHLLEIINDLLDFSKIESGAMNIHNELINMAEILKDIEHMFIPLVRNKGLEFNIMWDKEDFSFYSDRMKIKQILTNLIGNSVKFTEIGKVELLVFRHSDAIEMIVIDSGIGINDDKMKKIFEPFDQGEAYMTKKYGGTGLGLAIVKNLVDILQGNINIKSVKYAGTTVNISIPVVFEKGMKTKEAKSIFIKNSKIKVLIAEDNVINQKYASIITESIGWELDIAVNGAEALQKAVEKKYDVILMDLQMPEVDGYTAAKKMREAGIEAIIIGVTAFAGNDEKMYCIQAGMNDCISKPYGREHLKDIEKSYFRFEK